MAFRVGQKVVCVDDEVTPEEIPTVRKGGIYTITDIRVVSFANYIGGPAEFQTGFLLLECSRQFRPGAPEMDHLFYPSEAFRPLVEGEDQLEVFRSILNDPGKKIPDDQFDKKTKRKKTKEFTESTNESRTAR